MVSAPCYSELQYLILARNDHPTSGVKPNTRLEPSGGVAVSIPLFLPAGRLAPYESHRSHLVLREVNYIRIAFFNIVCYS